ncbi:MAG: hypothetical protein QOK49_2734 [Baekduia sp.]|jgi:hypothetical protein|nr:hypothetical protein [Baekduia sp.]MDX6727929.1 hypothetical protein [Baekduia sp.]
MTEDQERVPEAPSQTTGTGGENSAPPEHPSHEGAPHDQGAEEPLGPATPDAETDLGDTPEAHDEIVPEDLPKDHPGRRAAERQAAEGDGTVRGNT